MLKKSISVLLTFVMIVSVFTIVPTSASAENVESSLENQQINDSTSKEFEADVDFVEVEETEAQEETETEEVETTTKIDVDLASVGETVNGFTYSVNNKEATITAYNNKSVSSLTIPEKIGGYKVTSIGSSAFANYSNLSSVSIPDSVITIGNNAFYNTPWYEDQPDGLVYAGRVAYSYKGSMPADTVVVLNSDTASVSNKAFYNQQNLKQIIFNEGLMSIGNSAFSRCTSLTEVSIPGSVTNVSGSSFSYCSSLSNVVLNNGITTIEQEAFSCCTALETITLPDSVTTIGREAFSGDVSLNITTLPSGLTLLDYYAFGDCTSLTEITIPKGTKTSTQYSSPYPFYGCENLNKMTFEDGMTTIPPYIGAYCAGLAEVIIPDTVTEISNGAFYRCTSLEEITIPDTVTFIGYDAFRNNTSLSKVKLSSKLEELRGNVFSGCNMLKEIELPKTLSKSGPAFSDSGLERVTFENGSAKVSTSLFYNCKDLKEVNLPYGTTTIEQEAFSCCTALETITLPDSVTTIGREAFSGDVSLNITTLPSGLTLLDYYAFGDCTSLTEITIPKGTKTSTQYSSPYPFYGCENLNKMTFEDGMTTIPPYIGAYCAGLAEVIIPDTVTEISNGAFYKDNQLENIYLPASMEKIGYDAFRNCDQLTVYCSKYSKVVIGLMDDGKDIITYDDTRTIDSVVLDDYKSYYEARNTTGSSFVCNYSIKSSMYSSIRNPYIKIKIPTGATISDQSLYSNAILCTDYSDYTSYITIPVKSREGKITFNLTFTGDCKMATYATLNYSLNGKSDYDIIDIINNDIPVIAVYSEDITSSDNVHVSGMAPVSTDVKIAVDGTNVSTVTSNKAGSFSADIKLPSLKDGKEYTIEASANYLGETIKNETTVTYRENAPELISFTMGYKGVTYDLLSGKSYSISFVPNSSYPFHFDVKFTNHENVGCVCITSTRNQNRKSVDATWNEESESFVFDGFFDTSNYSYVPGKISVVFYIKNETNTDNTELFESIKESTTVTELVNTKDVYSAEIDFGNNESLIYTYRANESIEDICKRLGIGYPIETTSYLAPVGAGDVSEIPFDEAEFILEGIKDFDKNVIKETVVQGVSEPKGFNALINNRDKESFEYICYNSAKKVFETQSIKYGGGILYHLGFEGEISISEGAKIAGTVYSIGKTIVTYNDKQYDIESVRNNISMSNLSQSQKDKYLKDVDKVWWGYTGVAALEIAGNFAAVAAGVALGPFAGLITKFALDVFTDIIKNNLDDTLDGYNIPSDSNMNFLVDPSGYVYACVESNRISGAKVTTYWIPYDEDDDDFWDNPDESKSEVWKADEYSQINPLFTDDNGDYAWDVPEGWWKVVAEKDGYETYTTEWLPVPPPQTDVNIGLTSNTIPYVVSTSVEDNEITLLFNEYMDPDTVKSISVTDYYNNSVAYTISYSKDEKDSNGKVFAKEYQLILDDGYDISFDYYTITVSGAENYSSIKMNEATVEAGTKPYYLGDADGNEEIDINDATFILRYLAKIDTPFTKEELMRGDVDGSGDLELPDVTAIQYYLANMKTTYHIGELVQ